MRSTSLTRAAAAGAIAAAVTAGALASCGRSGDDGPLEASGTFEVEKYRVVATATGKLDSFDVEEGGTIGLDQVVAVIDSEDLLLKRKELEATLEGARSRVALLEGGVRPEDIKQLKAVKKGLVLQKSLADKNLDRATKLHDSGGLATTTLDEAETKAEVVDAQISQVTWQLKKAKNGALEDEIDIARAAALQVEAGLAQLDKLVEDRTIKSPIAGKVIATYVHAGEYVYAGQLIATVADLSTLDLVVYVPEKDIGAVRTGDGASVVVDGYPGRSWDATVSRIAEEAEFTPSMVQTSEERTKLVFEVELSVPNPDGVFKPGMPGDAVFGGAAHVKGRRPAAAPAAAPAKAPADTPAEPPAGDGKSG